MTTTSRACLIGVAAILLGALAGPVRAQVTSIEPMYGGVMIDGYDFEHDMRPQGSIVYDAKASEFRGHYNGLKMPPGRRAIFAWLHDTARQKTTYLGVVGWLKLGTVGLQEADFIIKVPPPFKNGTFGSNEFIGFTAEDTNSIAADGTVVARPREPSGSALQKEMKPAFYLYAKLPGAKTAQAFCGHGKDFFYAKDPGKQTCYD